MNIHYLEIITQNVEKEIAILELTQNLEFGNAVAELGNARVATTRTGESIGVRAPMHDGEKPIIRPYFLTKNLSEKVEAIAELGADIALPSMTIPGRGEIAIYMLDGIEYGLWQVGK